MIIPKLNKNSSEPLYVQLFDQIAHKINIGTIKGGTKLPSQREFAKQLGVSINTVVNAYNMLIRYKYVSSENRSGYYVNDTGQEISVPEQHWHNSIACQYNFSKNGVDLKMCNDFKRVIRQVNKSATDNNFTYPDYRGDYELRRQICSMLNKNYEFDCTPTQIVVAANMIYLLDSLIRVIGSDLTYGFENPAYYRISDFMRLGACKSKYLNVSTDGIDEKELKDFDADVLFLMPDHHYPICYTMTQAQREAVLNWAGDSRYIIEYGLDMEYVYDGAEKPLFLQTKSDNVIFMSDFSKTISPGLNIAYLVLPDSLMKRWQNVYLSFHSGASESEQQFVCEILKDGSYYRNLSRLRKLYNQKRECLISTIEAHPIGRKIKIKNALSGTALLIEPYTKCDAFELVEKSHKAGVKFSCLTTALVQPNELISPYNYILGFGELTLDEIKEGTKLLLDTWEKII